MVKNKNESQTSNKHRKSSAEKEIEAYKRQIISFFEGKKTQDLEFLKSITKLIEEHKRAAPRNSIPLVLFYNEKLSALETIVKWLKQKRYRNTEIAKILNRSSKTIWAVEKSALEKMPEHFDTEESQQKIKAAKKDFSEKTILLQIPAEIFYSRKQSVLESLVAHLKDTEKISFKQIALAINRDYKTVWTCYSRYKKKQTLQTANNSRGDTK